VGSTAHSEPSLKTEKRDSNVLIILLVVLILLSLGVFLLGLRVVAGASIRAED